MSEIGADSALGEIVEDRVLDGRLRLLQPRKGHRAGSDAILLAAALPQLGQSALLDMGAGVGTVGLAAALMQPELRVTLLERDPDLVTLAARNAMLNDIAGRVTAVAGDVTARAAILSELGLAPASFDAVAMNPPFYSPGGSRASPIPNRKAAHVAEGALAPWLRTARRLLRPGGHLALIHRVEALPEVLAGLETGFGAVAVRPVHAFADKPAIRIIVTAILNSRKPATLLPAFVINGADGRLTPFSDAVHRGRERLAPDYQ